MVNTLFPVLEAMYLREKKFEGYERYDNLRNLSLYGTYEISTGNLLLIAPNLS